MSKLELLKTIFELSDPSDDEVLLDELIIEIRTLMKENPNDFDLGFEVRKLFNEVYRPSYKKPLD